MYSRVARRIAYAVLTAGLVGLFAVGCGKEDGQQVPDENPTADRTSPEPVVEEVTLYDYRFSPESLTIPRGGKVTFRNKDPETHNVTIAALDVDRDLEPGETWTRTFETTGEFAVENQAVESSMKMTIIVEEK
ncbi:MAG: cupredoxin domain-containing protein [Bradymonadaceae bacterium]